MQSRGRENSAGKNESSETPERGRENRLRDAERERENRPAERRRESSGRVSRETPTRKRETRTMTAKSSSSAARSLIYRKRATAAVVLHVESDLHDTPTGAVKGAHLASSTPPSSSSRARVIICTRVTTC